MKWIVESLPIKISLIILCSGSAALILLGYHYVNRFKHEIDERIVGKLHIPAYLMSQRVLNLDTVADDVSALENLVGEEIVQAFIVKKDGTIFFASDVEREGQELTHYLHKKERIHLTKETITESHITDYTNQDGSSFLSILAPLRLQFEESIDGYLYLKINAANIQQKKDEIVSLFFLGSTLTIVVTTLLEVIFVHVLIIPRVSKTVSVLEQVEKGNLAVKIQHADSPDELGHLQRRVNSMISEIENASYALRQSEERYRVLFEEAPISLWEEDLSEIRHYFDHLKASGVVDLPTHLSQSPDAVQHCAKLVNVLDVNKATVKLFDADNKQDLLADLPRVLIEASQERFREELIVLAKGDDRFTHEFEQRTLRGGERQVILHLEVAPDYKTSLGKVLISLIDITKRKQAEDELQQYQDHLEDLVQVRTAELKSANKHLQQEIAERTRVEQELRTAKDAAEAANHAKSIFLANMSHELRTPLNAILGFAQLTAREQSLAAVQRENLNIIIRSGEHLLTLINDILNMSKIEAGRMTLMPHSFDLYQMLRSLEEMVSLRAARKNLPLVVSCISEIPQYITADEAKLRQVLLNLLSNAVKFTEQGEVQLLVSSRQKAGGKRQKTENRRQKTASSKQSVEGGRQAIDDSPLRPTTFCLQFTVKDTGLGIAPEEMPLLFEAFVQTQSGRKVREGTGLGLAICRKFVQLMGGELEVNSQEGIGTTCSFEIQVEAANQSTILRQQSTYSKRVVSLSPGQPEYRILVVDDQYENRTLLRRVLQTVGFRVQEAVHGEEAVARFVEWQPHAVLLDIRMPGMDGHSVARRIRAIEAQESGRGSRTILVTVSASAFDEDLERSRAADCDDFVQKPFREAEIFHVLEQHLGVRYMYEETEEPKIQSKGGVPGHILTPSVLRSLPLELLENLDLAVDRLNLDDITAVISAIRAHNVVIAEALTALAERFRYREIRKVLRSALEKP